MKEIFNKCRMSDSEKNLKFEITNTILIVLFGIVLGVFAKLIENISIDYEILWQKILDIIDLRNILSRLSVWALFALGIAIYSKRPSRASINVFGFFVGMLIGYYTITITVSGFFPRTYIIAWCIITLFTPILAFLTWYSKGRGWLAIVLSSVVIGFFFTEAFSFGMWYISISYYAEFFCMVVAIILLFKDKKQLIFSLIGALVISPFIQICLPYIFGGL